MIKSVTPYLIMDGNCRAAMTFYKEVFGGDLQIMDYNDAPPGTPCPAGDKNRVMHAYLKNGNFMLLASDTPQGPAEAGANVELYIDLETRADFDRTFQALGKGGSVTVAPHDAFWGSHFAMLTDKFGYRWMLATPCGKEPK